MRWRESRIYGNTLSLHDILKELRKAANHRFHDALKKGTREAFLYTIWNNEEIRAIDEIMPH